MSDCAFNPRAAFEQARLGTPFASLPIRGGIRAGDASTFRCHTKATFSPGTVRVYDVEDHIVAWLDGTEPTSWTEEGSVHCDGGNGVILSAEALAEIEALEDEFEMFDRIDDVDLPAQVTTPGGLPIAAFAFLGDGVYCTAIGYDEAGQPCALVVHDPN